PVVYEGHVMNKIKSSTAMELSSYKVSADLPQIIICVNPALPCFPESSPPWKVIIYEVSAGQRGGSKLFFDRITIVRTREHPNFLTSGDLLNPVPANAGL